MEHDYGALIGLVAVLFMALLMYEDWYMNRRKK